MIALSCTLRSSTLISWWDMAQFKCEELLSAIRILDTSYCNMMIHSGPENGAWGVSRILQLSGRERDELEKDLPFVEKTLKSVGLRTSAQAVFDFRDFLHGPRIVGSDRLSSIEAATQIRTIQDTIRREMSTHVFLYVPANRVDYYQSYQESLSHSEDINEVRFGEEVTSNFPSIRDDVLNAGNCLAVGQPTACVFHLMRIIERGLRTLGAALNDPSLDPRKNPTWEAILRKCDDELKKPCDKRSPGWQKDSQYFAEAVANTRAVKDAWRNPSIHVEIDYDDEKALAIFRAVRAFMRHLAKKLREEEKS